MTKTINQELFCFKHDARLFFCQQWHFKIHWTIFVKDVVFILIMVLKYNLLNSKFGCSLSKIQTQITMLLKCIFQVNKTSSLQRSQMSDLTYTNQISQNRPSYSKTILVIYYNSYQTI